MEELKFNRSVDFQFLRYTIKLLEALQRSYKFNGVSYPDVLILAIIQQLQNKLLKKAVNVRQETIKVKLSPIECIVLCKELIEKGYTRDADNLIMPHYNHIHKIAQSYGTNYLQAIED